MVSRLHRAQLAVILGVLLSVTVSVTSAAPETVPIGPGTTYTRIYRPEGPWAIHVVEADLSEEFLRLRSLLGADEVEGGGPMAGRRTVADMMAAAVEDREGGPEAAVGTTGVAAVNGDFFALAGEYYATTPLGLQIENGELVTLPDPARSALYLLADGTAHVGRFRSNMWLRGPGKLLFEVSQVNRSPGFADLVLFISGFGGRTWADEDATQFSLVGLSGPLRPNAEVTARVASIAKTGSQRIPPGGAVLAARGVAAYALRRIEVGDEVRLSVRMEPEVGEIREAVGGGPRLVRDGVVSVEHLQERFSDSFASRRHPRTGVGIRDGTLVLATVDGRQPGYSDGMTLYEFAELFLGLGCTQAMNFDGGGSATMVVRDRVVNSPSSGVARAVVNALALFSAAPSGPPEHLSIEPADVTVLSGESAGLAARGLDKYHSFVPLEREGLRWQCATALGSVNEAGVFTAAEVAQPTLGLVMARWGELTAATVVRVVPGPARIVVAPSEVRLAAGARQQFFAQAYDAEGQPIRLPAGTMSWLCEPSGAGAAIDQSGLLAAPLTAGRLRVMASVGEVWGEADVVVGKGTMVLEDFEVEEAWSYRGSPPEVSGSVEWRDDPLSADNHCLCLRYDFSQQAGTRTAHAELDLILPETSGISVRVLGDGQRAWLRARLRDGAGRTFMVNLVDQVRWSGEWRALSVALPDGLEPPVTLESLYLAEYHADRKPKGEVFLDDISAAWTPEMR